MQRAKEQRLSASSASDQLSQRTVKQNGISAVRASVNRRWETVSDSSAEGIEQSPFDEKVDAIATVLDEFPSMQILKAVERLAADPNAGVEAGDVITIAANLSAKEEDKPSAKHESIPRSVEDNDR